jgi:hypothetical protein
MIKIAFIVGIIFLIQLALVMYRFDLPAASAPDAIRDPIEWQVRHSQLETSRVVSSAIGSVVGCLLSWGLATFLRLKELGQRVEELRLRGAEAHGNFSG